MESESGPNSAQKLMSLSKQNIRINIEIIMYLLMLLKPLFHIQHTVLAQYIIQLQFVLVVQFYPQNIYLVLQASDKIEYCDFSLDDSSAWKRMSLTATASMTPKMPCFMPLTPPATDANKRSADMEIQMRILIIEHRSVSDIFLVHWVKQQIV